MEGTGEHEEDLRKMAIKRKILLRIRKRQLIFLGQIMRTFWGRIMSKGNLENLTLREYIEGKNSKGVQGTTYVRKQNLNKEK